MSADGLDESFGCSDSCFLSSFRIFCFLPAKIKTSNSVVVVCGGDAALVFSCVECCRSACFSSCAAAPCPLQSEQRGSCVSWGGFGRRRALLDAAFVFADGAGELPPED